MRGFWMIMESMIACFVIGLFLLYIAGTYANTAEAGPSDAGYLAYDALKSLDGRGVLRADAVALNFSSIDQNIDVGGYNHTVNICEGSTCYGPEPDATDIWVGSYFIAGSPTAYRPIEVKLFLWE